MAGIIFSTPAFAQKSKDTLYAESVSFTTESIISISCPDFEENFDKYIKFNLVTGKDTLAILDSFLRKVRYAKKDHNVDVRAKFIYHKEDGTQHKICMSRFYILIDGRLIKDDKRFFSFLKALII